MNLLQKIKKTFGIISAFYKYAGAMPSPRRPYVHETAQDAHLDINSTERRILVARSRELERDNPYWSKFLDIHEHYTIGRGISLTPQSSDPEFNAFIKEKWTEWSRHPFIDSDLTLEEGERMLARAVACDGDQFIIKCGSRRNPMLQVVECQRVATPDIQNENIIDGIEVDALGNKIAYYIRREISNGIKAQRYQRIPADQVIHVFNPARFGQLRGLPLCTNVINDLIDLTILHTCEMDAAKFNSATSAVWKTTGSGLDADENPFGGGSDESSESIEERQSRIENILGGRVLRIDDNESLVPYIASRPTTVTQEYWEFLLKKISAGIGYSDLLIFPRSVQGTVVRANLETTAAHLRSEHEVYAAAIKSIYEWFAGFYTSKTSATDWWKCATQPPRSPIVDIERNSNAIIEETRNGIRSMTANCAELGRSFEDVLREKAQDSLLIKKVSQETGIPERDLISSSIGVFSGNLPKEESNNE